ncbi:conserved hypothetical protein [Gloeothece citriformis PCC 7424]|uniref:O-antigen ligase-related domain-containing protein n=1 Tax=Gloeothece citriformis (strain PCC 7424) TaxID=65393 RepID=B7KAI6_GLOC7|nr:O-antigen ligase family protein [Gloeothece citriformis]ACK72960.1 conserved hypothetical protein [Gloeothece citriformis PCC 7424]
MKPQNLPEALIWYYIICTYLIYFIGAQSVFAPLLGLFLVAYLLLEWWEQSHKPISTQKIQISLTTWIWILAVLTIGLTIIVGGINSGYGIGQIAKSFLNQGWLRVWGVLGLFMLVGSLNIRPQLLTRAICILCLQSLIIVPIVCLATNILNVPDTLYTSPLQIFKGNVDGYTVRISYGEDGFIPGIERLVLLAPWPTPFGFLANIYFIMITQEPNKKLRYFSMFACLIMVILSGSRLALLCLIASLALVWILTHLTQPWLYLTAGVSFYCLGLWPNIVINSLRSFQSMFDNLRAGAGNSTNARDIMVRVGIERWKNESPIWGHTPMAQDNIPKPLVVTPIGSHHTWVGLLFDHGLVGCVAFGVAMTWSFINLLIKAQTSDYAKAGLGILITLTFFSFGEPIPTYTYLLWPGFLFLGILFKGNEKIPTRSLSLNSKKANT